MGAILPAAAEIMMEWAEGIDFGNFSKTSSRSGDFVQLCRRSVDILRQLQAAADHDRNEKLETAIQSIDRGVVQTRF